MGDDAAARAAHVGNGAAAVQQLLVPEERVAGLAAERRLFEAVLLTLRCKVRGGVGELLDVARSAVPVGVQVRREAVAAREVLERTGIGMHVLQADRGHDQLATRRRRHVVRVDVVLLAAATLEVQRVDRHHVVTDELAHGCHERLGQHDRSDQVVDEVHVVQLVDLLTRLVGRISEVHAAGRAPEAGDERVDHDPTAVLAPRRPCVVEPVRSPTRLSGIEQPRQHQVAVALPQLAPGQGRRWGSRVAVAATLDLPAQRGLEGFWQTAGQRLQHHAEHVTPGQGRTSPGKAGAGCS